MIMGLPDAKLCLWIGYLNDREGRSWQRLLDVVWQQENWTATDLSIQLFTCHAIRFTKVIEPYTN